ncbi:hypothetical protein [Flavobacterium sp.]|uniref:hypothetical protein n=1 Tax=Flavobacterium sp. TaxID=239 RepID=UPI002B4AE4FF|nr:hypothetical protein [Flavobacterium sp.]HLF51967.1 hypothetical protein [Flavobacterium sp.]
MKKKISIILFLILNFLTVNAQFSSYGIEGIQKLKKTKTYVVLTEDNEPFNKYIKKAVEENWKITPYEFISYKDLDQYKSSDANSFLLVSTFNHNVQYVGASLDFYTHKSHTTDRAPYKMVANNTFTPNTSPDFTQTYVSNYGSTVISIQMGGVGRKFNTIANWMVICYAGMDQKGLSSPKIIPYIKLLNNTAELILNENLKKLKVNGKDSEKIYNTEESIANKTLLLWEGDIPALANEKEKAKFSEDKIKENFTGKFKIVNENELLEKIESKDEQFLYFGYFAEGTFSAVYLYDANGKIYFYDTMGRVGTHAPETTGWLNSVLRKFDIRFKK